MELNNYPLSGMYIFPYNKMGPKSIETSLRLNNEKKMDKGLLKCRFCKKSQ